MSEIRWTDKVYLDSQGNIRSMDGCPTDLMTQALIDRITTNVGLSQPLTNKDLYKAILGEVKE